MPGPVGRWLETFMCKQYADLFEAYGFKTLHSVCQLQPTVVQQMGIPPEHCDKILENVSVLRQSLVGPVVSSFSEQNYDHQLASHGQGNNSYSYHSPSSYPSPHQYGNPNGQINHLSYQTGDGYPAVQSRYRTSNQDVYGQTVYNNHLLPNPGSWEEPMRLYNHSPRHLMGNSPPPNSPMMRSPPPMSPSSAMTIPPHYSHHVIMDQTSAAHHHAWSSSQVMSPSMVNSPRGTPSPGMGHLSNLSSPVMAACSPARVKPFSPPPYSPHPPPAHQQTVGYDYPPSQTSSPLGTTPNRHLASSGVNHSPSDPLQSLQKMVLLDAQNVHNGSQQSTDISENSSPSKCKAKLTLGEQVVDCETKSTCLQLFEKSKRNTSASPEASSTESTDSSLMSTTPPPTGPLNSDVSPTSDLETAKVCRILANARDAATSDLEAADDSRINDHKSSAMVNSCRKCGDSEPNTCDDSPEMSCKTDAKDEAESCSIANVCSEVKAKSRKIHENYHDIFSESYALPRPSLLRQIKVPDVANLSTAYDPHPQSELGPKNVSGSETQRALASNSTISGVDAFLCSSKNLRKKQKNSHECTGLTLKSLKQLNNHPGSKFNGDKFGNWNLELSPDVTFVAKKMRGGEAVVGSFEIVNNCSEIQEEEASAQKRKTPIKAVVDLRNCSTDTQQSPRRSGRLHLLSSEIESTVVSVCKLDGNSSSQMEQQCVDLEKKPDVSSMKSRETLNGKMAFKEEDERAPKKPTMSVSSIVKSHCDSVCSSNTITSSSLENNISYPRKRGRPRGSKNRPREGTSDEAETKKGRKKKCNRDFNVDLEADGKKQKPLLTACDNFVIRKSGTEGKIKGPFLHFESTRDRLVNVTVVNTPVRDEEGESKAIKKRSLQNSDGTRARNKVLMVGFNSTLSANYDVFTKDKSWVCSLCHNGSHHKGLGDLFGPYFEENEHLTSSDKGALEESGQREDLSSRCPDRRVREKRKRSELVEEFFKLSMAKKGKRVQEASKMHSPEVHCTSTASQKLSNRESCHNFGSSHVVRAKEFWVHEDCIVWCHGIFLLGQRIVGIKEAIAAAEAMVCSKCLEGGATLGCLQKGCKEHYHYLCAIETGCLLEEEAFSLLCSKHKVANPHRHPNSGASPPFGTIGG